MSSSLPVRILLYNSKWDEDIWVQFYENMFPPSITYADISIDTEYHKELPSSILKEIETKCLQVYKFFNNHTKTYDKIVQDNFEKVNEIMGQLFDKPYPARAAYEVAKLPKNSSIEIETIAYQGSE